MGLLVVIRNPQIDEYERRGQQFPDHYPRNDLSWHYYVSQILSWIVGPDIAFGIGIAWELFEYDQWGQPIDWSDVIVDAWGILGYAGVPPPEDLYEIPYIVDWDDFWEWTTQTEEETMCELPAN